MGGNSKASKVTKTQIEEFEAAVDQTFLKRPLPHVNRVLAVWYYLTAAEDSLRNLFCNFKEDDPRSLIVFYVDRYKYAMRHALSRIFSENNDTNWTNVPRKVVGKLYIKASQLIRAGIDYSLASQLCASLHTGTAKIALEDNCWHVHLDDPTHDSSYGALELLGVARHRYLDPATIFLHLVLREEPLPDSVNSIAISIRASKELLDYDYEQDKAIELSRLIPQSPHILPETWMFEWGDRSKTNLLLNALIIRCMYHIVAIHFGSALHGVSGGGVDSLVLVMKRDQLTLDLELMSGLETKRVRSFVSALTWGHHTTTPDPALQPLIPMGSGWLAIPCIHILSSNLERNLLSLMARTRPDSFDAQSNQFEREMVTEFKSASLPEGTLMCANVQLNLGGEEEEIDTLLFDVGRRTLLVAELRWMLGPGDPREILNRQKECLKKVDQVRRKVDWAARNATKLARCALGPDADTSGEWKVSGIVLLTGYAGTRSADIRYPIMPLALFLGGLQSARSLDELISWCQSLSWLPQLGRHFEVGTTRIDLEMSKQLKVQGLSVIGSATEYLSDALAGLSRRSGQDSRCDLAEKRSDD